MANKIISFGNNKKTIGEETNLDNHVVFKDIAINARYMNNTNIYTYTPSTEFVSILKSEGVDEILYDSIYTLFMLQYKEDPNHTIKKIR